MARQLNDWISSYLEYTENSEPPTSYHLWTAVSVVAGALQRKVWLEWGFITLYPNLYIVLIGPPGRCRKGTAMGIGAPLLRQIGVRVASESITREALIREMLESSAVAEAADGVLRTHCSLTVMSGELMVFIGDYDPEFLSNLTDWYDSHDTWTYRTKTQGTDKLRGVCLNLLGATAPDWISLMLPKEAIGGGFTSRIIFVAEKRKRKIVTVPFLTEHEKELRDMLVNDLADIHLTNGPFVFTTDAMEVYIKWYRANSERNVVGDPKFGGYCERRPAHLLKLCMIVNASRISNQTIDVYDIERAIALLEAAEVNMASAFSTMGQSRYAEATMRLLEMLKEHGRLTRKQIMLALYKDVDEQTLRTITQTVMSMGLVRVLHDGGEVVYEYAAETT